MKLALILVALLWFPLPLPLATVQAGTVTFDWGTPVVLTSTPQQDAFLATHLADVNARRAAQELPAWTIEQLLRDVLVDGLTHIKRRTDGLDREAACTAFNSPGVTAGQRNQIITTLGGRSPCP